DRPRPVREHAPGPARELALAPERFAETLRRTHGRIDQRQAALDEHELLDALRKRTCEQRADRGTAGVADEAEAPPAERVGDVEHVADVLRKVVPRIGRTEIARAVPGGVDRH